jgi:4,5-DOPA dioxygenase extradiol
MSRAPVLFVAHGAPTIALERGNYAAALERFGAALPRPRAALVVSAHWSTSRELGLTSAARHRLVYDFSGFPAELYGLRWPAPGAPDVAAGAAALLAAAGLGVTLDPARGLDHGTWMPLRFVWPEAHVPIVQLSLPRASPRALLALGAALAPLRDEGVLLVASGGLVHNLARVRFGDAEPDGWALAFDAWCAERIEALDAEGLARWREDAPAAALAAPTSEHFDPVLVALGARAADDRVETLHAGIDHGNLAMRSFVLRPGGAQAAHPVHTPRKEHAS